jgi:hypothetical protein
MDETTGIFEDELCVQIGEDDEKLTVIAKEIEKNQWELSVINVHGIYSVWLESYCTAQEAIDAGIRAIRDEGLEAFSSTEGFGYMHE